MPRLAEIALPLGLSRGAGLHILDFLKLKHSQQSKGVLHVRKTWERSTCKLAMGSELANGEVRWRDRRYQKVYDISAISFEG